MVHEVCVWSRWRCCSWFFGVVAFVVLLAKCRDAKNDKDANARCYGRSFKKWNPESKYFE